MNAYERESYLANFVNPDMNDCRVPVGREAEKPLAGKTMIGRTPLGVNYWTDLNG